MVASWEHSAVNNQVLVSESVAHAELDVSSKSAEVDPAYRLGLIKAVRKKELGLLSLQYRSTLLFIVDTHQFPNLFDANNSTENRVPLKLFF